MIRRKPKPVTSSSSQEPQGFDAYTLRLGDIMRGERATMGKSLLDVQRDLKIRASYIAAIENADAGAFEAPGFVAGYVRSYARYLGLDSDWAYRGFCAEAGFETPHGLASSSGRGGRDVVRRPAPADPLADPNPVFAPKRPRLEWNVEPGAVGSLAVLAALIGVLGFGGWKVLTEVQKVALAPVEKPPVVLSELDPVGGGAGPAPPEADDLSSARPREPAALDLPELVARDGPIAAIRPGAIGALSEADGNNAASDAATGGLARAGGSDTPARSDSDPASGAVSAALGSASGDGGGSSRDRPGEVRVTESGPPGVTLVATRPAWVRVRGADGAVLLEKILDAGEDYTIPRGEAPAELRTGFAGAVFFVVGDRAFGPAGEGPSVASGISLTPAALTSRFNPANLEANPEVEQMVARIAGAGE